MTKEELVELVNRKDFLEYMGSLSKEEVEKLLGPNFSRMVGFEQKNIHHCYDLYNHILHTVDNVENDGLSPEEVTNLKISALFHDIGKPDVATFNSKTGQQVFYGHAKKSEEIAREELKNVGLSPEDIEKISFYIEHHDDFISYKKDIPNYMKNHMYVREINSNTVAEKMVENNYNFEAMGLNKEQIRYVCSYLANGKEPDFTSPNGKVEIDVDMDDVRIKMASGNYLSNYIPSKRDYELLVNLCKADANAQTKYYEKDGKVLCSRKEKIENMDSISNSLEEAYLILDDINIDVELNKNLLNEISKNEKNTKTKEESKKLYDEYNEIDINKKEK